MKNIFFKPNHIEVAAEDYYREYKNAKDDYPNALIIAIELTEEEQEKIKIFDDIDGRSTTFYVDIPAMKPNGEPSPEWRSVASFKNKAEAIKFAQEKFGADENGMVSLITC